MSEKNKYDDIFDLILTHNEIIEKGKAFNIFDMSTYDGKLESLKYELRILEARIERERLYNRQIDASTVSVNPKIVGYFLPKKVREEFMGDMYELVAQMENEERKKYFIWFIIILQYVFVMLGLIKSLFQFNVNKEISNK